MIGPEHPKNTNGAEEDAVTDREAYLGHVQDVTPHRVSTDAGWHHVDIRFLLPTSLDLRSPVGLFRASFPPGAEHRMHTHPGADEFFYIISGRAALGTQESEQEAGPGTVQLIPAGMVHWLRNLDTDRSVEVLGGYLGVASLDEAGYHYVGPKES